MKAKIVIRMVIYGLIILVLTSILIGLLAYDQLPLFSLGDDSRWDTDSDAQKLSEKLMLEPSGIQGLEIFWVSGDVNIKYGDSSKIIVDENLRSNTEPLVWKQENGTLQIRFSKELNKKITFGLNDISYPAKDLTIVLPRNFMLKDLNVEAINANVAGDGLSIIDLELETISGNAEFTQCTAEEVSLEAVSGRLKYSGTLQDLDIDAVSGDCELRLNNCPNSIDLDTVSGDINIYLPNDSGFTVITDTLSGNFNSDFPIQKNSKYYICGDGQCKIDVDGISGDLNIYVNQ